MREIHEHKTNPANRELAIRVTDEPGHGWANYRYEITGFDYTSNASATLEDTDSAVVILFQNGPIKEFGINGLTQEALLAIVIDRLRSFQNGPFACQENSFAFALCQEALFYLNQRTYKRMACGVEGTSQV